MLSGKGSTDTRRHGDIGKRMDCRQHAFCKASETMGAGGPRYQSSEWKEMAFYPTDRITLSGQRLYHPGRLAQWQTFHQAEGRFAVHAAEPKPIHFSYYKTSFQLLTSVRRQRAQDGSVSFSRLHVCRIA